MPHETIDLPAAQACMSEAIAIADSPSAESKALVHEWIGLVRGFSAMCEKVGYRTSMAVLGNAMLAKAANERIDVFSLKAGADHPGAYDARRTAENVLVPASQQHKFHLGVLGPQPLNNQPFFRTMRIESKMTVRKNARPLLAELLRLLHHIGLMRRTESIEALAAFVIARRGLFPTYDRPPQRFSISTREQLALTIDDFVRAKSEKGARAMACAAGILDASFGEGRVRLGKLNEPDRQVPGDIGLRAADAANAPLERVFEIRDKAVAAHTIHASVAKAMRAGVQKMSVVAVNKAQKAIDAKACRASADEIGSDLAMFLGWDALISSLGVWSPIPELTWVETVVMRIRVRLQEQGLPATSVLDWDQRSSKDDEVTGD
jgi:SacI-like restriction endonuclease